MSKLTNETIRRLIFDVRKPSRYTGSELNQIKKHSAFIRMAICYPDLYEVGMSNNGIRILYDIANSMSDVACERVFAVPEDFENKLRESKIPLYTLETYTPLCELDVIGFNVAYELLYTNILQILDLGHIPLLSKDRTEDHPIVIAGGESISNPLPVQDFFDAFFIGDGEEGIIEILNIIRISKNESLSRKETLKLLTNVEGIYVPSMITEGQVIKKRILSGPLYNPLRPIMPNLKITQERFVIEVTRGCANLCNFCHAGFYELPYRYGNPELLRDQILKLLENAYYSDLTLSSLSISDYRHLVKLLNLILPVLIEKGVSISLPSLRVDKRTLPIIEQISDLRKTSLTFAVESACDEIRNMANKKLRTDDILTIAEHVFNKGWNLLKLYFMIGLPGCEGYDEAGAIIKLLKQIYMTGGKKRSLNITISPFVPKPHTPFQWEKQMDAEYFRENILIIKRGLPRQISIKAHDVNASMLEGIISRGDSELNQVIYNSYNDGARLDSWTEYFKFDIWKKNLDALPSGWERYLMARNANEPLSWGFISSGFDKLIQIRKKRISIEQKSISNQMQYESIDSNAVNESLNRFKKKYEVKKRIRIRFTKKENAKYVSHLDFMSIIIRALRITDIPVSFTQGFNKRERIAMGFPSPVGIESLCELCDVDLYEDVDNDAISARISNNLPEGIAAVSSTYLEKKESIMSITSAALFSIEIDDVDLQEKCIKNLQNKIEFKKQTEKKVKVIDFNGAVIDYNIQDDLNTGRKIIQIKIFVGNESAVRIDNIALSLCETGYEDFYKLKITKLSQYKKENAAYIEIS